MNEYLELEKLYYKKINVENEYLNRINNPCTFKTTLYINPINKKGEKEKDIKFELFYLPIADILKLQDNIMANSKAITELASKLPNIAQKSCIKEIMLNEIVKSNQVEGVYTTKKEVYDSITSKKLDRLTGITKKYIQIVDNKIEKITKIEEFREMYDDIFSDDILLDPNNKLDGKIFRKSQVHINDGLRNIHTGDASEELIIEHLNDLIKFMNNDSINFLIKASITHYYFEYIHPFYDGNGRTGRLLCSMYLTRKLDIFTGLSLSFAIFNEKNKYSKLFKNTSDIKNFGEVTFFIKGFLELIVKGQESILEMLKNKKEKLSYAFTMLENLSLKKIEKDILFIYLQNYIFSKTSPLKDKEMSEIIELSRPTLDKLLKKLETMDYISKISSKPSIHTIGNKIKI
ncbi:Fic family protein [Fusobacterium russii]|uniref:Fic family protein n=1 Tax=Fusobacterium russii TaxID=854 RepID=UPI0003AA9240|nr:Fic family protein [Fusobacterium russii]